MAQVRCPFTVLHAAPGAFGAFIAHTSNESRSVTISSGSFLLGPIESSTTRGLPGRACRKSTAVLIPRLRVTLSSASSFGQLRAKMIRRSTERDAERCVPDVDNALGLG